MLSFLNSFTKLRDLGKKDKINIREKLAKESEGNKNIYEDIKKYHQLDFEDFIFVLGDRDAFKQKYLIPHYKMYNLLEEINEKIKSLRDQTLSEKELEESQEYFDKKKLELAQSKIEIYFCNAVGGDPKALKTLANIAMPFGLLHTGLLIDDICIQWGRGKFGVSIVEPWKDVKYGDYIFAIELQNEQIWSLIKETYNNLNDYITSKKPLENMGTVKAFEIANTQLDQIAEVAVEYNKNKKYHIVFENCQHFVTSILNKIKLKIYKDGEVGKILKIAGDKGNPFEFQFGDKAFKTRKDLDEFALQVDFEKLPYDQRMALFDIKNVFEFYRINIPDKDKYDTADFAQEYWSELLKKEKFGG